MYSMLSTPVICASIGVATACSIVSASAPTYFACTRTSGGAMLGYRLIGSWTSATIPSSTSRIEMTMATIGRSTKKRDTGPLYSALMASRACLAATAGGRRPRRRRPAPGGGEPLGHVEHRRDEEDGDERGRQHAPEHGGAEDAPRGRPRPRGHAQRKHAEDEGERGHQDGAEAEPRAGQGRLGEGRAALVLGLGG